MALLAGLVREVVWECDPSSHRFSAGVVRVANQCASCSTARFQSNARFGVCEIGVFIQDRSHQSA
jgi:hypothetical protein